MAMIMNFLRSLTVLIFGTLIITTGYANTGITPPSLTNSAYVLMDYDTGEILAQKNADIALPPASLTKMMTSYIVEQRLLSGQLQEDTPITMSQTAWCRGSSSESCMYVPLNGTATALEMLKGIIIQSGNDASKAIAEHIAGSENAFASLMNEEAKKLGMNNTHFVNSTGMPAEGHKASARDLAVLAKAIIQNSEKYYPIYSEKEFTYNNIKQGNRNALLLTDPTVDGLKTGHTEEAGYCLVSSSKKDNMRLIAVIMGANSMQARADQSRELLAYGFQNFTNILKAPKGQSSGQIPVKFGKTTSVEAISENDLKILTTKLGAEKITTQVQFDPDITAPVKAGQKVGQLVAIMDGKPVASTNLIAASDVEEVNIISRLWQSFVGWVGGLF